MIERDATTDRVITCSVVMPVANIDDFTREAIASVCKQSLNANGADDLELVVVLHNRPVADGEAIRQMASGIDRLTIIHSDATSLAVVRNAGIEAAAGQFYAVLDSDDLMYANRLADQIEFLRANPECIAVGGWTDIIDENGRVRRVNKPRGVVGFQMKGGLLYQPALTHSCLVMRMGDAKRFLYSPWFRAAHDQELLLRLSRHGAICNLQRVIGAHRIHQSPARHSLRHNRFQALANLRFAEMLVNGTSSDRPFTADPRNALQPDRPMIAAGHRQFLYSLARLERRSEHAGKPASALCQVAWLCVTSAAKGKIPIRTAIMAAARFAARTIRS